MRVDFCEDDCVGLKVMPLGMIKSDGPWIQLNIVKELYYILSKPFFT